MISNDLQKLGMKVLMAHRACKTDSAAGRVLRELGEQLVKRRHRRVGRCEYL